MNLQTDFEYILLKKLVFSNEFFSKVRNILHPNLFVKGGNSHIFNLIKTYYNEYQKIPSLTELVASVKNVPNAEIRKTIVESLQTINKTEEVQNVEFMVNETIDFVKDSMYTEALRIGSEAVMKKDDNLKLKAKQLMEEMSKISVDTDLGLDFDDIEKMIMYYQEHLFGILTQHKEFNKRLGTGFLPGTLSIILASSGIGKSLLKTDLISGMIKKGKKILLVSMEMSDKEMMKRVHTNALDLPINSLNDLGKTENELKKLQEENPGRITVTKEEIESRYKNLKMSGNLGKLYIKDYPSGYFSAGMLDSLLESYKNELGIEFDIVFLDYLGIMKSDLLHPSAGLYSYVKSIVEEVRAVAKKRQVPIISSSQLNRSAVNSTDASNDSVSDSLGTVQTADFMIFLLQTEEMKAQKKILCKVTKNRFNGRTDSWEMDVDYNYMRFKDSTDLTINPNDPNILDLVNDDLKANINIVKASNKNLSNDDFGLMMNDIKESSPKGLTSDDDELNKLLGL